MLEDPSPPSLLITGAAGFIGGEMARRFADRGLSVGAFDLPGRPAAHLEHPRISVLEGDVTSSADCEKALRALRPSAVIHCAALMGVSAPREAFMKVNAGGTQTLAAAAARAGVRRFIYVSSVTVHGMPPRSGIDEDAAIRSIGLPYADSKIAAEEALRRLHERGALAVTILRPGDVYGPRAGEWVIKLVQALRAGRMILIGGGRGLINLTYVDNLTDAAAACLESPAAAGQTYLITDGAPVTWKVYLDRLAAAARTPAPRISVPAAAAWPLVIAMEAVFPLLGRRPPLGRMGLRLLTARCTYSIDKARRGLGWQPAVGFEEGMRRVTDWIASEMPGP